jgi:hypothetical protein
MISAHGNIFDALSSERVDIVMVGQDATLRR